MEKVRQIIADIITDLFNVQAEVTLTRPDEQFGDYATNVALQLGKQLNKNPQDIAQAITANIHSPEIEKAEVAGPGFINITLSDHALLAAQHIEIAQSLKDKTVVAEYSDPNPFKVLHAGHLYTTITGDVIAKLVERAGARVHRLNYGGDVGLHVGRTMWAILEKLDGENPEKLKDVPAKNRLEWLSELYVKGTTAYEEDDQARQAIIALNKRVYQIHNDNDHDSSFAQIYWTARQWSYDGFEQLYKELHIAPFEKYIAESEVTPLGVEMVEKGLTQGIFKKSEGAVVYEGEAEGLHTRVFLNSEGLPTYEAKDLGLAAYKWQQYTFDLSLIITANDIVEYMKVVLKALAHFYPEIIPRSKHLTHGVIKLPGGNKMSSRRGNILAASDILSAATQAIKESGREPQEEVVLAAVKYAFLKSRIGGDIIYDPAESVALEGNSGPYLQYSHARACSILNGKPLVSAPPLNLESGERSLIRKLTEYPEVVTRAIEELMPHHICTYLYELAQTFNRFYEKNRVIDDPREKERLYLVRAYTEVLKDGLNLLNITAPEKM